MAGKRFFWLKLQEDFFQQKAMKKLRRMERGEILVIIYLKMQLASLRNGGVIAFEGFGDSFAEELSLQLDEREEDVSSTVEFLVKCGLMEGQKTRIVLKPPRQKPASEKYGFLKRWPTFCESGKKHRKSRKSSLAASIKIMIS